MYTDEYQCAMPEKGEPCGASSICCRRNIYGMYWVVCTRNSFTVNKSRLYQQISTTMQPELTAYSAANARQTRMSL